MRMRRKGLKIILFIAVILLVLFLVNKKPHVSNEDATYIDSFLKEWQISTTPANVHQSFESELSFISTVHDRVIEQIKHEQIDFPNVGDVEFYYKNRKGFCYDRAILMEKIFSHFGFEYRHVYAWFAPNSQTTGFTDLFKAKTLSHAMTEIRTLKGWMLVDSNVEWRGIDKSGRLMTIANVARITRTKNSQTFESIGVEHPLMREKDFYYAYGIYSRHGKFLPPRLGVPDVNLRMLLYNL